MNSHCEAGVNYRELVGGEIAGWVKRRPCDPSNETDIKCDKFEPRTAEEVAQAERERQIFRQHAEHLMMLIPEVKAKLAGGGNDTLECPVCKGKLHVSVSSHNGHCHGSCETEGCLSWME
ncbi:hypothetical protein [Neptuniibacter sp. QD37_11]|uniref:hypothetical protein n=1 Tax=Neptuniibacter sp. QD37_11 TaxID=3398209 RepID=UPI0039F4E554